MKLQRLTRMGISELGCRSRQELSKWLERVGAVRGHAQVQQRDLSAAGRRILLDHFRETGPDRFFAGAVSEQMPIFLTSSACGQVLAAADAPSKRDFDLLGYHGLNFGDPIDWHVDPTSGRRAPLVHWGRLNPLDHASIGDSKVIWELNRHQWLVHLAQAYRLTGDECYARKVTGYIEAWREANPPGMGINWASSLEVALRLIAWCWVLFLIRRSKALSPELFVEMLGGIEAHAVHVERYLSTYFSPNTHLTGEALGLFYAGVGFPQLRPAGRWRALGMRILEDQIERQVLPDGVYFEQATCYQRYTVEIYLHFLILAARNGITVPAAVRERVQKTLDFLLAIRWPDGSLPQIGDADGGWLLPLAVRAPDDVRGIFSTAAALFGRADYAWAAGGPAPETLWLLGTAGLMAFDALRPTPPAKSPSALFGDGGYTVMRSGWDTNAHHLIFDVGPLGCSVSGGHGHADLLSIQCAAFGESMIVDPGTYCYTAESAWRHFFRSTAAHSTVRVDGRNQAVPAGPFAWKERPSARLRRWVSTNAYDFADADHAAYRHLLDPVAHRRRVLFVKPRYWVLADDLDGAAEHRVELRFQCAPTTVTIDPSQWVLVWGQQGSGLWIRAFATVPLAAECRKGEVEPIQGWNSANYGQRQPAPVLVYTAVTRLPLRILTLIYPTKSPSGSPPKVAPLIAEGPGPVGLALEDSGELIRFDEHGVVVKSR